MSTAAHNLCRYIIDKYKVKEGSEDFYIRLYNMSDADFRYAIEEHYEDDFGLHGEWT